MHHGLFVRVEFTRGSSIESGKARFPWHWCLLQNGHIYSISGSFADLKEATEDFMKHGVAMVEKLEKEMAGCYSLLANGNNVNAVNE